MKNRKSKKRFTSWLIACAMLISMIPFTAVAAEDNQDFNLVGAYGDPLTEGTDYTYSNGALTIKTATPVAVSMKSGVIETDNIIVIDANGHKSNVILHNVDIKTGKRNAVELKNNYIAGGEKVTLEIMGMTTLEASNAGIAINETPLLVTSDTNIKGTLNIKNSRFGIDGSSYNADVSHPIEIGGALNLNITDCGSHAVFNSKSSLSISGSPVIKIDNSRSEGASQYALYGIGIDISGGTFVLSNNEDYERSGYVISSGNNMPINISGSTDITIKSAQSGIYANGAVVTVKDNAKIKMYDMVNSKKAVGVTRNSLTCGGLIASDNALIDIVSGESGISATKADSKISGNAHISVTVDTNKSKNLFAFRSTLDIADKAVVNLEALTGDGIEGFKGAYPIDKSNLNISDNAQVSVKGTKNAIYTNLNMSGNSFLTVSDSQNGVEYTRSAVFAGNTKAEITTTARNPISYITVKPENGRAYLIKSGVTKDEAAADYYAQEQRITNISSNDRYFFAEPANLQDVTITGKDKVMTYDGNTVDISQLFDIDENAGEASYSIIPETGEDVGSGTLADNILTVTKTGKFTIKVNTAAKGAYRAGEQTAFLTVNKGTAPVIHFEPASDIIYGDSLTQATFPTHPHGEFKWENETIIPDGIGAKSYKAEFIPNDADLYDYSLQNLTENVTVQVKPRPVEIQWTMPESLIYDGYVKNISPDVKNTVGSDQTNIGIEIVEGDQDLINAGTYKIRVESVDNPNYTLENGKNLEIQFTITAKILNADNITAIADATYTKEEIKPIIEVKNANTVLILDKDYKVTYENNINAGTAKVNVEFIGNYSGTATKEFTILPKTIDKEIQLFAPVKNGTPQTELETDEYSATVVWTPEVTEHFAYNTVYTATVTIVPKVNYTTDGIAENSYVFENAQSVQNAANSGNITVMYPATGSQSSSGGGRAIRCTVSFDTNGGSALSKKTVTKNSVIKEPAAPTKDGFYFAGWYTDKELTTKYDFSAKVTKDMTLYAAWSETDNALNQIILTIGKKSALVFGKTKENDVAPKIVNNRTMLPARFVAENLGANVSWDDERKLVTINGKHLKSNENITILIYINSDIAYVNGKEVGLDSPAFIENNRTYTPIRFIAENLGASVEWFESEQKAVITK